MNFLIPDKEPKLTEAEIMKALECCGVLHKTDVMTYKGMPLEVFSEAVLDLINSKNAEIERLEKEVDRLSQVVLYHDGQIAEARAEAIKEFAERAKKKAWGAVETWITSEIVTVEEIDQIAKEMGVEL